MKKSFINYIVIFGIMTCTASLPAASVTWTAGSGNWQNGTNWSTTTEPGSADIGIIRNGGTATIDTSVPNVNGIEIGGATLSQLNINSGGSITVTGSGITRIGYPGTIGAITVNGGSLTTSIGAINVGFTTGATATLTIQNGGTVNAANILLGSLSLTGITATLNIGGATTSTNAGWFNGSVITGNSASGASNTVNFNHTGTSAGSRYEFTKGPTDSTAVVIQNYVAVNAKAGITVLTGGNTYTNGTTVKSGAVLLANYSSSSLSASSTGTGTVNVESGGVLGGTGYILGATTVAGTIKAGDYDYFAATPTYGILKIQSNLNLTSNAESLFMLNGTTRGTSYSAIDVAGSLTLDGSLNIELGSGFSILANQTESFQLFNLTGAAAGAFGSYVLPSSWNGMALTWDTSGLSSSGFTGYALVTAVPEPSTFALLTAIGAITLIFRNKGKKKSGMNASLQ